MVTFPLFIMSFQGPSVPFRFMNPVYAPTITPIAEPVKWDR